MRTLVTGATGLIGRQLLRSIENPVVLSRQPSEAQRRFGPVEAYLWAPEAGPAPSQALRGVEAVFNLAGESVSAGRWTDEKKRRIRDSRVVGTRNLVAGFAALESRPRVLVSASAVGYYGDRGDEALDERSDKSMPVPTIRSMRDEAAMTNAPAITAAQEIPEAYASLATNASTTPDWRSALVECDSSIG